MAVIQFKRGSSVRWDELNPILAIAEPGYDTDSKRIKIGDGVTAWKDLPYIDTPQTLVNELEIAINKIDTLESKLNIIEQLVDTNKSSIDIIQLDIADIKIDINDLKLLTESNKSRLDTLESNSEDIASINQAIVDLVNKVDNKVDKQYTINPDGTKIEWKLLSPSNEAKLDALVIGETGIEISGTVNASNVEGLADWITENAIITKSNLDDELKAQIASSIIGLAINDTLFSPVDGIVNLPIATQENFGLVKLGEEFNISEDDKLTIDSVNVTKLIQTKEDVLELNCGAASNSFE